MYAVKFAIKLQSSRKRWFMGPRFLGGEDTLNFDFQITLSSEHVAGFGWASLSELAG